MSLSLRFFFIAVAALYFFLIASANPAVTVSEARTAAAGIADAPPQEPASIEPPAHRPATSSAMNSTVPAQEPVQSETSPPPQIKAAPRIAAWINLNDWQLGAASAAAHANVLDEVSPSWYTLTRDGDIVSRPGVPVDDAGIVTLVREKGLILRPLVMSVSTVGPGATTTIELIENPAAVEKQIAQLTNLAVMHGYDGIDLDYESIPTAHLGSLAAFVETLAASLHAHGKTLAVSIETKTGPQAQAAWKRIGAAADSVRLMAYGNKPKNPAPVVDLSWMKERLAFAAQNIPTEKLMLGIPTYCYQWGAKGLSSNTWQRLHAQAGENVFCQDADNVKNEMEIAMSLGVERFALWRLGGEDPEIWSLLQPSL